MNNKFYLTGLLLGALSMASCQKDAMDGSDGMPSENQTITRTLHVEGNDWTEDGEPLSRSVYEPGVGIRLTGTETMSVLYSPYVSGQTEVTGLELPVKATPNGDGTYSFSHSAIGTTAAYNYYFVMPHLITTKRNGAGTVDKPSTASYSRLSPVQMPSAASFDPNADYLIGYPQENVAAEATNSPTLTVDKFKRLFAPFRLAVTDPAGVLAGETIRTATLSFDQAVSKGNSIIGLFYVKHSTDYTVCGPSGWEDKSLANAVTALYPEGLAAAGAEYPVWYMLNPVTFAAGTQVTLTVSTDTKTITRTATLSKEQAVMAGKINRLTFGLTGAGYTETASVTQDFTSLSSLNASLKASDGKNYTWAFNECSLWKDNESTLPNALRMSSATATVKLPTMAGKTITGLRIFEHANNANGAATDNMIELRSGETVVGTYSFNYYGETSAKGGVCEIDIPAQYQGTELTLASKDTKITLISAITMRCTVSEAPEPLTGTYYEMYSAGKDIQVGNITINNTTYPTAVHITAQTTDPLATLKEGGLIFLDNDVAITSAEHIKLAGGDVETIVIGNDPKAAQPTITGAKQMYPNGSLLALKNVNLTLNGTYGLINASEATATKDCTVILQDCTYAFERYGITDNNVNDRCFTNILVDNCVLKFIAGQTNGSVVRGNVKTTATGFVKDFSRMQSITITNSVIYCEAPTQHYVVEFGNNSAGYNYETINLKVMVNNCSLYNIWQSNILVRTYKAAGMYFGYNAGWYDNSTVNKATYLLGDYAKGLTPPAILSESNHLTTNNTNGWLKKNNSNVSTYQDTTSAIHLNDTEGTYFPYATADVAKGYFPINRSVVTNTAGATYDTKLWSTWQ